VQTRPSSPPTETTGPKLAAEGLWFSHNGPASRRRQRADDHRSKANGANAGSSVEDAHSDRSLLAGLNIDFGPGRFCAVVGPNGSGKTTLLRLLAGLIEPQRGRVLLDGSAVSAMSAQDRAARIAYIPQAPSVWAAITVRDYISLGRFARPRCEHAVESALQRFELVDLAERPANTLSAGQLQRSAIARAVAQLTPAGFGLELDNGSARTTIGNASSGAVLLADEPLSALDPRHSALTLDLFQRLAKSGWTVIATLHDLNIARQHAHDALLLPPGPDATDPPDLSSRSLRPAFGPARQILTPESLTQAFGVQFRLVTPSSDSSEQQDAYLMTTTYPLTDGTPPKLVHRD